MLRMTAKIVSSISIPGLSRQHSTWKLHWTTAQSTSWSSRFTRLTCYICPLFQTNWRQQRFSSWLDATSSDNLDQAPRASWQWAQLSFLKSQRTSPLTTTIQATSSSWTLSWRSTLSVRTLPPPVLNSSRQRLCYWIYKLTSTQTWPTTSIWG